MTSGWYHACGLRENGSAYCWGRADWGNLGKAGLPGQNGNVYRTPQQVDDASTYAQLALGQLHTCGIRVNASMACWVSPWGPFSRHSRCCG